MRLSLFSKIALLLPLSVTCMGCWFDEIKINPVEIGEYCSCSNGTWTINANYAPCSGATPIDSK
jgi:hypothetical protein